MRYLLLAWRTGSEDPGGTDRLRGAVLDEALRRSGRVIAMEELEHSDSTLLVRMVDGTPAISEGPLADSGQEIGCFYLIEARDLNEALHVASRTAAASAGWCVEVRPVDASVREADPRHAV